MSRRLKISLSVFLAGTMILAPLSASAHVSIRPGLVIGTGGVVNAADSVSAGKSGYVYFRPGHGCSGSPSEFDPSTGLALSNKKFATHAFSVTVPIQALGTGAAATVAATTPAAPKAQYIPGWTSSSKYNSNNKSWTITWTATSADFDIPDASANEDPESSASGGNVFAEFGVSVKWNSDVNGQTIAMPAKQVCVIPKSAASPTAVTRGGTATARTFTLAAKSGNKNVAVDVKVNGVAVASLQNVTLGRNGSKTFTLTGADATAANATDALVTIHRHSDGKVLGYYGGKKSARTTVINWDGTNPATTAYVDGVWTESSAAPSIIVQ